MTMPRKLLNMIKDRWAHRPQYATFDQMPNGLLTFFAAGGFLVAAYYGWVFNEVMPHYLRAANQTPLPQWGWSGWVLTCMLAALGYITWIMGSISWRCNGILRDRLFK